MRWSEQPKEERECSAIQEKLNEVNRFQYLEDHAERRDSRLFAGHYKQEAIHELLSHMDVIPVLNMKTGYWELFK